MPDRFPFTAEVRNMLRQAEFYRSVNYNCIYYTIHEAVVIGEEILDDEAKVSHTKPSLIKLIFFYFVLRIIENAKLVRDLLEPFAIL